MRISDWSSDVCSSDLALSLAREESRQGDILSSSEAVRQIHGGRYMSEGLVLTGASGLTRRFIHMAPLGGDPSRRLPLDCQDMEAPPALTDACSPPRDRPAERVVGSACAASRRYR